MEQSKRIIKQFEFTNAFWIKKYTALHMLKLLLEWVFSLSDSKSVKIGNAYSRKNM